MNSSPFVAPTPEPLKSAQWMWAENHGWNIYNCYAQFRKTFSLSKEPAKATLWITADQSYQLYVNGEYVCRGPARGFQAHWPYDEVDIGPLLKKGANLIAIRAYNPGVSNFQYVSEGWAGVLVALQCGDTVIVSDKSWKCRRQTGVVRGTVPSSLQLFPQEHIDLRTEDSDWMKPDYQDESWPEVRYATVWNSMPWPALEPRGIPLLEEKIAPTPTLLGVQSGSSQCGWADTLDVAATRAAEGWAFKATTGAATALTVPATEKSSFTSYLLDFGKTVVGCLELHVSGAIGGETIDTLHFETVAENLVPEVAVSTHCRLAMGTRLICRAGENRHQFYHPYGFRYLILTVRGAIGNLSIHHRLTQVAYPLERLGSFSSSDKTLERIWETCEWTQRCCSLDAYVDTPWREQAQWWGDARVQGWNTFHINGDARLFRRGIHCIASQTTADGVTYGHSPTMAHECVLPDFTLIWMITLWDFYWQTGSTEPFTSHFGTIERALDYFEAHTDPKIQLLEYDDRYWLFLDWCTIFKDGYPAIYNLWYYYALQKLIDLSRIAGAADLEKRAQRLAEQLKKALEGLIGDDGLLHDGRSRDGRIVSTCSVHAQTLAIVTGLAGDNVQKMIETSLLPSISVCGDRNGTTPSSYWITYVYSVLVEHGHGREVLDAIRKYWTPMAEHGTTWEVFSPNRGHESFSHAWSAHPLFHMMQSIGGIRQTAPAWKSVDFAPVFDGEYGGAVVPSPHGLIESRWKREGAAVSVELRLPQGVEARVVLPGVAPESVTGTNCWTIAGCGE